MPRYEALGRRLTELLGGPYRDTWFAYSSGRSHKTVDPRAIAEMLRNAIGPEIEALNVDAITEAGLEARVRRLLGGTSATPLLIASILATASFSQRDAKEIRALYGHAGAVTPIETSNADIVDNPSTPLWQTLQLTERHYVGPQGVPLRHTTRQTIQAIGEIDRYPYRFDTDSARVRVIEGGTAGQLYGVADKYYAVDIIFGKRLTPPAQWHLEYETELQYTERPDPSFRRASLRTPIPSVDIRVEFDPAARPRTVWWAAWPAPDAEHPTSREEVELVDGVAFRSTSLAAGETLGFLWEF